MLEVLTVKQALKVMESNIEREEQRVEKVSILESLNRVSAADIRATSALPPFNRSSMDGYAVKAKDTFGASESMPALLKVTGEILMGSPPPSSIQEGEAMSISTGGMLPEGSNAVVMVEYTEDLGAGEVAIYRPVAPGENVLLAGDDLKEDETILKQGERVSSLHIALLAAQGVSELEVLKRPLIGIISTGDELVDINVLPSPGKIRDVNSYALAALVHETGAVARCYGLVNDDAASLKNVLDMAVNECHLVLVSGGSSVGNRDITAETIDSLGKPGVLVHGVSMRPGKPTIFGIIGNIPVFGLSGNPSSAMITFDILVKKALLYKTGLPWREKLEVEAKIARNLPSAQGREDYLHVVLENREGVLWAVPIFSPAGFLMTMLKTRGLVKIEQNLEGLKEGQMVKVQLEVTQ